MGLMEKVDAEHGEMLESVEVFEPGLEGAPWAGDYGSYTILIATSKRTIAINGCHDVTPDIATEDYALRQKVSTKRDY